jgi:hypothetical protein
VLLLCGGDKRKQSADIKKARGRNGWTTGKERSWDEKQAWYFS